QLWRRGAAIQIDVASVRRATDRHDLGTQIGQDAWTHFVTGSVRAIDHELVSRQIEPRNGGHAKLLVLHARLVYAHGTTELTGTSRHGRLVQELLDLRLHLVRQLAAVPVKELDAVVFIEVVGRADDDAKVTTEMLRHVGDARRRQRSDQHD